MKITMELSPDQIADMKTLLLDIEELIGNDVGHYGALRPLFAEWFEREAEPGPEDDWLEYDDIEDWVTGFKVGYMLHHMPSDITEESLDAQARRYYEERKF